MKNFSIFWIVFWFSSSLFSQFSHSSYHLPLILCHPGTQHVLGCDSFGRDLLQLLLKANLYSSLFSFAVVTLSLALSILAGAFLALAPQKFQFGFLRTLDFLLAFPTLLLALGWAAVRGPGLDTLLGSLLIGVFPGLTRLMYVRSKELLAKEYIAAAFSLGASSVRVVMRHVSPELFRLGLIKFPALFASGILAEATLSYLGIGVPIGNDSWGTLLAQSRDYLLEAPHLAWATGIPLFLTVLSLQRISEFWSHSQN